MKKLLPVALATVVLASSAMPVMAKEVKEVKDVKAVVEQLNKDAEKQPMMTMSKVVVSPQKVSLNGKDVSIAGYNIDGENYFKLSDLAMVLNQTSSKFSVEYSEGKVLLTLGQEYKNDGKEVEDLEENVTAEITNDKVYVVAKEEVKPEAKEEVKKEAKPEMKEEKAEAKKEVKPETKEETKKEIKTEPKAEEKLLEVKAYKIKGNNYYRLRDVAKALNMVKVEYNEAENKVLISTEEAKKEIKPEMKEEAKKEIKPEIKEEAKKEVKPEMKEEKAEAKKEIKAETKAEEKIETKTEAK
ncbi:MAG: hypothetical protein SOR77_04610 [Peptoniphilus sp.]|uniref:hypothetical protein n=1 Tax=Peptoniphilus sp. TaxID=1971214 RepID=UPI002A75E4FE|nr:hypothetical protein [Peptoniphilus sp.]MDY2986900.1 hypothetical protein [Peptoniphilus sp.]